MNTQLAVGAQTQILPAPARKFCIPEVFEAQVERTPDARALSCGTEHLTYRELNERANHLANYLRKCGVGPETPVALYLERSLEMVVSILGVLKAGGAYVPIDLAYPKDRLGFMLEDSQAPIIITQGRLREQLPAVLPRVIFIDSDWPVIAEEPAANPATLTTADNAAYIIYTSGSTGKPKGVLVTHHNVVRLLQSTDHWYGFNSSDVWPLFHSYAFDVSVFELWGSLFYGGRLVVVPYLVSRSPHEFYQLLARENVTVLNQTPSAFRQLIWAETTAERKEKLNLRYVICAGEALELQSLKPWFEIHGDEQPKIVNMYGITEITVHATYRVIRKDDLVSGVGSVIGVPIPDLQLYLVDEDMQPVARGTPGEICVGGAGVARGYLNRPELTAKRFLADPFSTEPGARLYRSGDLAQYTAAGELEYLGRMDHQVKIRGFRVELGEIESALNKHPAIRESVVLAQDTGGADKRLIAYLVPVATAPNVSQLREHLGKGLPDYMVPAVFIFLDKLPLTTNGKVDRRALPAPDGARPELKQEFVAPKSGAEQQLAAIWEEVLELDKVGANDNFFELGGDSIRSIAVLSKAKQQGLNFTLEQIFSKPTVAGLAACAGTAVTSSASTAPFSLVSDEDRSKLPADIEDAYPMAKLQMGMFFRNEMDPVSAIYHDVFSYRIAAGWDEAKLERAVNRLAERHSILRTSFHLAGFSEPLQVVHKYARVPFSTQDLRQQGGEQQQKALIRWIDEEKRRPFDRTVAPLLRFHAQRLEESALQLIISFHHACLDGWSLAAVMTEVVQEYAALLRGSDAQIESPGIRYRDFVALERAALASPECRRFWQEKFQDAALQSVPRWPKEMCEGGHEQKRGPEIVFEPEVLAGLKRLGQMAGVPLKTVLLAAHQRVMNFLYGQNDVTSGLLCNGRPEAVDGEKLVGLFLNTLPVRTQLNGGTWLELVKQCFIAEQEIIPHRRFPMAEIQRMNGGRPLFEAAFDFVHFHVYKNLEGSADTGLMEGHYFEANDLTVFTTFMLDLTSTQLQIHLDYDPNFISRQQAEMLTDYYVAAVRGMAANPESRYDTFVPLSEAERQKLLVEWNATEADYPREKTLHQLFEQQAAKTPDQLAVRSGTAELTYAELNLRSSRLASKLRELGAGPGVLVGLCAERTPDMLAGLLGILKSAAAYVPMDPGFPAERLAQMVSDSGMPLIVCQQGLEAGLPASSATVVQLEQAIAEGASQANPVATASSRDLAYVIYTSGSTGKPKGVAVEHRSVVNLLTSAQKELAFAAPDNLLAVTTLSFDIAGLELFMPLLCGATVTLATREQAGDGTQLAVLLDSSGATTMQATPATWRMLIDAGWRGKPGLKLICGGEALKRPLADELLKRAAEVWNFYGPTETTIWSTAWKVTAQGPISIGRPLANTQVYILDEKLQPAPLGTAGQLYIGGDGLARGYWRRPELTAEKFVANPFDSAKRIYNTGDLARYLPDGRIECLGRNDQQVKIRGFRIELGEIESVLRQHSGIADAVVAARPDAQGESRLVGYVISRNGPPSTSELREFVRNRLPVYMVPAQFVSLKEFPLTPNGKVDSRRLPAPEATALTPRTIIAPSTPEEERIAAIWREVLSLKEVSVDENFFEAGGDSLSATRAFARINEQLGSALTLREIFEHPTILELAKVATSSVSPVADRRGPIRRQPRLLEK